MEAHLPTHHMLSAPALKGTQVCPTGYYPRAVGQRQIRDVAHLRLVGLSRARLVKQQIRGAPPVMGRIGRARGKGIRLAGGGIAPCAGPIGSRSSPFPAIRPRDDGYRTGVYGGRIRRAFPFPRPVRLSHGPGCRSVPLSVGAAGHHARQPAKLLDEVLHSLLVNEM